MARLILALWASLVSAELAGSWTTISAPAKNLSCFQCFKVSRQARCRPQVCRPSERVCVSHQLLRLSNSGTTVRISMRCAVQCPNSNSLFTWSLSPTTKVMITRRCCGEHLCNIAPDTQEGLGALLGDSCCQWSWVSSAPCSEGPCPVVPSTP